MSAPAAAETPSLSAECTVAKRPGYRSLHADCRQTEDMPLPGATGVLLVPRCGCVCHTRIAGAS